MTMLRGVKKTCTMLPAIFGKIRFEREWLKTRLPMNGPDRQCGRNGGIIMGEDKPRPYINKMDFSFLPSNPLPI